MLQGGMPLLSISSRPTNTHMFFALCLHCFFLLRLHLLLQQVPLLLGALPKVLPSLPASPPVTPPLMMPTLATCLPGVPHPQHHHLAPLMRVRKHV